MSDSLLRVLIGALIAGLLAAGWFGMGWPGVGLVAGGVVFWLLLHFTRVMQTLQRAAKRPKGYVDSAVMLNARLQPGMNLLTVIGLTRSLGEERSKEPEVWRWSDNSGSWVDCEFSGGKLARFELVRPPQDEPAPDAADGTGS